MKPFCSIICIFLLISCVNEPKDQDSFDPSIVPPSSGIPMPKNLTYSIISQYPHDTSAFTQGLELYKGKMLEGTGDYEHSSIRITNWKTGQVEQLHKMGDDNIFGEGITVLNDTIYQLTWQSNLVYVYSTKNINKPIKTLKWPNEGWGITHDKSQLIISDGTSNIHFVNPTTFKINNTISVRDHSGPVDNLNELEFVDGFIYANIYTLNDIVKIDPESGYVVGRMNLSNLLSATDIIPYRTDVLNGIAYDSSTRHFIITGKRWPKLFEIKVD